MNNGLIRYRGDFALLDQVRHVDVRRKGKEENGNGIRVFSSPIRPTTPSFFILTVYV